jgi:antitoxin component YwqK of YwqJK toxin-antitoxin module
VSNFDELESDDSLDYVLDGQLFTGEVVETDNAGRLPSLITVVRGEPDGPTSIWFPDGTKKLQETIKEGRPVGITRTWHANGVLAQEEVFDEQGHRVSTTNWDDTGLAE